MQHFFPPFSFSSFLCPCFHFSFIFLFYFLVIFFFFFFAPFSECVRAPLHRRPIRSAEAAARGGVAMQGRCRALGAADVIPTRWVPFGHMRWRKKKKKIKNKGGKWLPMTMLDTFT